MHRTWLFATALICFSASAIGAEQPAEGPNKPVVPPASGTLSSDLNHSGGVIAPPSGIDPEIKQTPPSAGDKMPVVPPPGTPGGDTAVKPK